MHLSLIHIWQAIDGLDLDGDGGPSGYRVNRKVFYAGRYFEHTWQPEWRLRLVRADRYRWEGLDPHDELRPIEPGEPVADLAGDLRHDSFSGFAELMRKHVGHAELMAQSLHAQGRRCLLYTSGRGLRQCGRRDGWAGSGRRG